MSNFLTVIVGAGASYDCVADGATDYDGSWRPPLTSNLFDLRPGFSEILQKYPRAVALSDEIRAWIRCPNEGFAMYVSAFQPENERTWLCSQVGRSC